MNADRESLEAIYADAFPEDSARFRRLFLGSVPDENVFVASLGERVACAGYIVSKPATLDGVPIAVDYISALGTYRSCRNRGLGSEVVRNMLAEMNRRGTTFAALSPFNDDFYLRFGFRTAMRASERVAPCGDVRLRSAQRADYARLAEIYDGFTRGFTLRRTADEAYFEALVREVEADGGSLLVALDGAGEPFGYAAQCAGEIVAYAYLGESIPFGGELEGLRYYDFTEGNAYLQTRIVNVEKLLSRPVYAADELDFTISVSDEIVAANRGGFRVRKRGGEIKVERCEAVGRKTDVSRVMEMMLGGEAPFGRVSVFFEDRY